MDRIWLIAYRVKNGLSIRNSRFEHQFPPGYNRSVLVEKLYTVSERGGGGTKGPTTVTIAAYP
jgi:hypothetical protein